MSLAETTLTLRSPEFRVAVSFLVLRLICPGTIQAQETHAPGPLRVRRLKEAATGAKFHVWEIRANVPSAVVLAELFDGAQRIIP